MRRALFLPVLVGLFSSAGLLRAAPSFDAIVAFGDRLTDTGNNPAEPLLHWQGRWSNGPLWIEYLSARLGLSYNPSNNFAISGAQSDDTYRQVTNYVPATDISRSLFVVFAGGNDFLQEYDTLLLNDDAWDAHIAHGVGSLSNAVVNLHEKGARFILVPNTVDVTTIPLLNNLPGLLLDYLRGKVKQFNRELAAALDQLQTAYPDLVLFRADFFKEVKSLLKSSEPYGFTETKLDALADLTLLDKSFGGPGADYVFWDPIHPTTKAHAIVADTFLAVVAPPGPHCTTRLTSTNLELNATQLLVTRTYTVQRSTDLLAWNDLQSFLAVATNGTVFVTNNLPSAFHRLKWTP